MIKVKKIDIPKPKKTKLYLGTLLLSWVPFVGLAFSLNGVIRSIVKLIKSKKAKRLDKRAVIGIVFSSIALLISMVAINLFFNPAPEITLTNTKTNTDSIDYVLTGKISNMESEASKLTINNIDIPLNNGDFSYKVDLKEGDNTFNLVAINSSSETKSVVSIHRTTKAELAAEADAKAVAEAKATKIKSEADAKAAKAKAEADAKAAAEANAQAEAQAQHIAYIDGLATTYCSNHNGWRSIYVPQGTSRDEWANPNKDLLTKYPNQSNCVIIMTFFVDTMPSNYLNNITDAKVGTGMNNLEVLAAWGWPGNNSNYSSAWGSSGTWTWDTGTCYYGVCPHQQYATFYNGTITSTGNY